MWFVRLLIITVHDCVMQSLMYLATSAIAWQSRFLVSHISHFLDFEAGGGEGHYSLLINYASLQLSIHVFLTENHIWTNSLI